jgi:hypothetical protein
METDPPGPWNLSPRPGSRATDGKGTDLLREGESTLGVLGFTIFLLESLNSSRRIKQFLLAGEERMAAGTDLDMDLFFSALRLKGRSAGALDDGIENLGVDILFHTSDLQISLCLNPSEFSSFFLEHEVSPAPFETLVDCPVRDFP